MTEFVSENVKVKAPASKVFDFLGDFTNFENLMPEQIKNWKADTDTCSFTIEGMANLSMRIAERHEAKNIHIVADGRNPIDYTIDCHLKPKDDDSCNVELVFAADLNPLTKALAARPLQNFVDMMALKLQNHFS